MRNFENFEECGCLCEGKRTGRPGPSAIRFTCVRGAFEQSLTRTRKSIRQACAELQIPGKNVWLIERNNLQMKLY